MPCIQTAKVNAIPVCGGPGEASSHAASAPCGLPVRFAGRPSGLHTAASGSPATNTHFTNQQPSIIHRHNVPVLAITEVIAS